MCVLGYIIEKLYNKYFPTVLLSLYLPRSRLMHTFASKSMSATFISTQNAFSGWMNAVRSFSVGSSTLTSNWSISET